MPELLSGRCWLYRAASGATCLYLTSAVYHMQTQERNPCVRGCDRTVELSRQEKENEKREKEGGNSTVTLVLTGGGGSRLCSLSGLPSVFHYSHSLSLIWCAGILKDSFIRTHIWCRSFISTRTGESDELMATFVNHKTTHCGEREEESYQHLPWLKSCYTLRTTYNVIWWSKTLRMFVALLFPMWAHAFMILFEWSLPQQPNPAG